MPLNSIVCSFREVMENRLEREIFGKFCERWWEEDSWAFSHSETYAFQNKAKQMDILFMQLFSKCLACPFITLVIQLDMKGLKVVRV